MAVLQPDSERDYTVTWLWEPLDDLRDRPKQGTWEWRGRQDDIAVSEGEWEIPNPPPEKPATNFSFRVDNVSSDFLRLFEQGIEAIEKRLTPQKSEGDVSEVTQASAQ